MTVVDMPPPSRKKAARIVDPKNPLAAARQFLAERAGTIHFHRGSFYQWDTKCWLELPEDSLRAALYPFLDDSFFIHGKTKDVAPVKPDETMIRNVVGALKAASFLPQEMAAPCWTAEKPAHLDPLQIIACQNGLLHLPSKTLLDRTPDFFGLTAVPFAYDENAPVPKQWLAFLRQLWPEGDEEINTLHEIGGYLLTPDTRLQKAFLLVGPRRSGKGTIGRILRLILGRPCVSTNA